jgi:hypothetical protein
MKYALLVHQSQEYFDRRDNAAAIAAGKAYGEALQAAGVLVGGAGLESPQAATTVSGWKSVHCWGRAFLLVRPNLPHERIGNA